jgi:hypothetical protein
MATFRVKITEVGCILLHLPAVFRRESSCTDFALHHDYQAIGKNDDV